MIALINYLMRNICLNFKPCIVMSKEQLNGKKKKKSELFKNKIKAYWNIYAIFLGLI